MSNSPQKTDAVSEAAKAKITAKRDELLAARAALREERKELLVRLRRVDREIADCKAAARFFDLEIEFPPDEDADGDSGKFNAARQLWLTRREFQAFSSLGQPILGTKTQATLLGATPNLPFRNSPSLLTVPIAEPNAAPAATAPRPPDRLPVRDFILARLAGSIGTGLKAAPIREAYETAFGMQIHEKTVGMTLYRLMKDGLVRREGHLWFLAPPPADAENPGDDTPGPINRDG